MVHKTSAAGTSPTQVWNDADDPDFDHTANGLYVDGTGAIVDRFEQILGNRNGLNNSNPKVWRLPGRIIDIAGCNREADKQKWKGKPHDLKAFDEAFWGHVGYTISNAARAMVMGLTGSHFVAVPDAGGMGVAPETRRYYQQLTRFSAAFAFLADISMGTLGGALKRKEKLSARLGDILSLMYLASAALKRFEDEGRQAADAPLLHWAIWDCMFKAQNAFEGVIANFPNRLFATLLRRVVVFPLGRPYFVPSDKLGHQVASLLINPSATRDRLTSDVYLPTDIEEPVGALEAALQATIEVEPVEAKVRRAIKSGQFKPGVLVGGGVDGLYDLALAAGIISRDEFGLVVRRGELRDKVIRVDDFPYDFGLRQALDGLSDTQRKAA